MIKNGFYEPQYQWTFSYITGEIKRIELVDGLYPDGYEMPEYTNLLNGHNIESVMERLFKLEANVSRLEIALSATLREAKQELPND